MTQCVRITLTMKATEDLIHNYIQKNALRLALEGVSSVEKGGVIKIVANGPHDAIDRFIDLLYTGYKGLRPRTIEIEPFVKDRDYRGTFRAF